LFRIALTTKRLPVSVATCTAGDRELYVNVSFVDQNRAIDDKLPQLDMKSIRQVLAQLDGKRYEDVKD
jgi:hypothetical protein